MKTLLFIMLLSLSAAAQQQDTLYCIQIMSTRNPHLIKPEMVTMLPDSAMIEHDNGTYRIMFVYPDLETAETMLYSWQRAHKEAFITVRRRDQVQNFYPLFTIN
jgi:hypothetical protein